MALARGIRLAAVDRTDEEVDSFGPGLARRALDVTLSTLALVVLAVPMLIVAVAIRLDSRGPSFYRQRRIGQGGRLFSLIKFRTMAHGSTGSMLTGPGDARVTRLGHFLRAVAIDELPQLVNVLAGHMTLVGPRPQTPGFAASYPPELREVFAYRPGIVGPGVLRLNDDDVLPEGMWSLEDWYLRNVVPARVQLDLDYLRDPTIRRTLALMAETLVRVPRRFLSKGSRSEASEELANGSEALAAHEIVPETNGHGVLEVAPETNGAWEIVLETNGNGTHHVAPETNGNGAHAIVLETNGNGAHEVALADGHVDLTDTHEPIGATEIAGPDGGVHP